MMDCKLARIVLALIWLFISSSLYADSVGLATTEWPPYVGTNLKGMGYVYVLVNTAFQNAGYDPVVEFLPWHEAVQLQKHQNDATFPEYESTTNTQLICSDPITASPISLFKRKSDIIHHTVKQPHRNQTQAFHGLREYRFGIVDGYINTQDFDQADFLKKQPVVSDLANLHQLKNNHVDLIIGDVFVIEYYIDKLKPEFANIEFMGPSLENKQLYVCFRKDAPNAEQKLSAFNQSVQALKKSGKWDEIISSYNRN